MRYCGVLYDENCEASALLKFFDDFAKLALLCSLTETDFYDSFKKNVVQKTSQKAIQAQ